MKPNLALVLFMSVILAWVEGGAEEKPLKPIQAIVKINAFIAPDARTAEILGKEREGSGVVIDSVGHILTIGYVILEAETIEVVRSDGKTFVASYVGYDHSTGFGIIKAIGDLGIKPLELGHSSQAGVGDSMLLVGYGGDEAIRPARVIARKEFVGYWEYLLDDAFYVSPPHPDFAGAAMLNRDGRLMGIGSIYTQILFPEYGMVPCNMFVPIDLLKPILNDLIQSGRSAGLPKPWLGMNADETRGRVFVDRVYGDGPADKAGLRKNDIILSVGQQSVTGLADFYRKVWALGNAGVNVPLTILQGSKIKEISVRSADRYQYLRIRPTIDVPGGKTEKII